MKHRLDPLLRPRTVAVIGASCREDSMGEWSLKNLTRGGFTGTTYAVNPAYGEINGLQCYASLRDLPETPDLAIFAVGDHRVEQALDDALAMSVPAAVLMSSLYLDDDESPPLKKRIAAKVNAAGMLVCGANGMGFYNVSDNVWACGFDSRLHKGPGKASLISHSGSGMCGIIDCEERLQINFAVSTGNEINVSMDQYLDFALDKPETRVVGLFVETARDPQGFRNALQKAAERKIPVVALKVGRTKKSAELTVSHSGAMAGDDDTYNALFHRFGVHRVADMDELATALITFSEMWPVGQGGLVTLHDSGGERQLLVDLADNAGVPLTELSKDSVANLNTVLDPELPAINPLDAWSRGGPGAAKQMSESLAIMMSDPGTALGALIHDRAPDGVIYESYVDYMHFAHEASGKPVALVSARQGSGADPLVVSTTHDGFPVLDGVAPFLTAVRGLMDYREFIDRPVMKIEPAPQSAVDKWSAQLESGPSNTTPALDELESLAMLQDFGVSTSRPVLVESEDALRLASATCRFPVALKSAASGLQHKTDQGGVYLHLENELQLVASYGDLSSRLGPRALLAEMAPAGVEMILGVKRDPQFGPVVVLGFGGVFTEVQRDIVFALPPFDAAHVVRCLDKLRMRSILDGVRGNSGVNVAAFCSAAERFSVMVDALGEQLHEVDVNPLIVSNTGCIAVDALVIGCSKKVKQG